MEIDDKFRDKLIDFLKSTEIKDDKKDVHKFAESLGVDPDIIELEIYKIVQTIFRGGKSFDAGFTKKDAIPGQFKIGFDVEGEHVDLKSPYAKYFQEKIDLDHETESSDLKNPEYYTMLKLMEYCMKKGITADQIKEKLNIKEDINKMKENKLLELVDIGKLKKGDIIRNKMTDETEEVEKVSINGITCKGNYFIPANEVWEWETGEYFESKQSSKIKIKEEFKAGDKVVTTDPYDAIIVDYYGKDRQTNTKLYTIKILKSGTQIVRSEDDIQLSESSKIKIKECININVIQMESDKTADKIKQLKLSKADDEELKYQLEYQALLQDIMYSKLDNEMQMRNLVKNIVDSSTDVEFTGGAKDASVFIRNNAFTESMKKSLGIKNIKESSYTIEDNPKPGKDKSTVKITFADGNSLVTDINTDLDGAKKYYLGKMFNLGAGDDDMQKAVKVELVESKLKESKPFIHTVTYDLNTKSDKELINDIADYEIKNEGDEVIFRDGSKEIKFVKNNGKIIKEAVNSKDFFQPEDWQKDDMSIIQYALKEFGYLMHKDIKYTLNEFGSSFADRYPPYANDDFEVIYKTLLKYQNETVMIDGLTGRANLSLIIRK
jgi:hypothetical protein